MEITIHGQKLNLIVPNTKEEFVALLIRPLLQHIQHLVEERITGIDTKEVRAKKAALTTKDFLAVLEEFTDGPRRFPQFMGAYAIGGELGQQAIAVPFERPTFASGWSGGDISALCMKIAKRLVRIMKVAIEGEQPEACLTRTGTEGRPC